MKALPIILVCILFLTSCKEVSFKEPQPAGVSPLREVPAVLRGMYQAYDERSGDQADTVFIESWGYYLKDKNDKDWLGRGVLSDSLVLKYYQDYYFVNFKAGDQWILRLIRRKPSGSIEFLSLDVQDEKQDVLKRLHKKFTVKEIKKEEDTFYQINPTPAQLMTLIKEGYFTGPELRKMVQK